MVNKSLTISLTKNSIRQILLSQVVDKVFSWSSFYPNAGLVHKRVVS